jgi:hypothetical protein
MNDQTLVDRMQSKANSAVSVALMRYNKLRSRMPNAEIAIVEGNEDSVFYSTIFNRLGNTKLQIYFVANGKDRVLGLRDLISRSKDIARGAGVVFFVDHDFDGLKNWPAGKELYVTPTYSVENMLVCREAFKRILLADFKMSDADFMDDVEKALLKFDDFLVQHGSALEEANRLIHHVRLESMNGRKLVNGSICDQHSKFCDVDPNSFDVVKRATGIELAKLIGIKDSIVHSEIENKGYLFDQLDPAKNWRGKFIFHLYRKLLSFMIEDRNAKHPSFFSKGSGKISASIETDSIIRTLASVCVIPACLVEFVREISSRKLV